MELRFRQLAECAKFAASIIGNADSGDFVLLALPGPIPPEAPPVIQAYRMRYCGVIGMVQGVPRLELRVPLTADAIAHITQVFIESTQAAPTVVPSDDWLGFMGKLWSLEDRRPEA